MFGASRAAAVPGALVERLERLQLKWKAYYSAFQHDQNPVPESPPQSPPQLQRRGQVKEGPSCKSLPGMNDLARLKGPPCGKATEKHVRRVGHARAGEATTSHSIKTGCRSSQSHRSPAAAPAAAPLALPHGLDPVALEAAAARCASWKDLHSFLVDQKETRLGRLKDKAKRTYEDARAAGNRTKRLALKKSFIARPGRVPRRDMYSVVNAIPVLPKAELGRKRAFASSNTAAGGGPFTGGAPTRPPASGSLGEVRLSGGQAEIKRPRNGPIKQPR